MHGKGGEQEGRGKERASKECNEDAHQTPERRAHRKGRAEDSMRKGRRETNNGEPRGEALGNGTREEAGSQRWCGLVAKLSATWPARVANTGVDWWQNCQQHPPPIAGNSWHAHTHTHTRPSPQKQARLRHETFLRCQGTTSGSESASSVARGRSQLSMLAPPVARSCLLASSLVLWARPPHNHGLL